VIAEAAAPWSGAANSNASVVTLQGIRVLVTAPQATAVLHAEHSSPERACRRGVVGVPKGLA